MVRLVNLGGHWMVVDDVRGDRRYATDAEIAAGAPSGNAQTANAVASTAVNPGLAANPGPPTPPVIIMPPGTPGVSPDRIAPQASPPPPPTPTMQFGGDNHIVKLGTNRETGNAYYDTPSNWGDAWNQVMGAVGGGNVGGNYYKWLQGWSGSAKQEFDNANVQAGGNLHVAEWLDKYAPGTGDIFRGMSAQNRGENPAAYVSGRALY